jgi:hypothetical protein
MIKAEALLKKHKQKEIKYSCFEIVVQWTLLYVEAQLQSCHFRWIFYRGLYGEKSESAK